jgi:hypothetical protein
MTECATFSPPEAVARPPAPVYLLRALRSLFIEMVKRRKRMDIRRKFWPVLMGAVAGMVIITCSCSSLIPSPTATPPPLPTIAPPVPSLPAATLTPVATSAPATSPAPLVVTAAPVATFTATGQEALPGLAGKWVDPDSANGDTISTIVWQAGGYVVTSVINSSRGGNELKTFSWANGVLTWEYCPADMQHCIIQNTVSLNGNTLTVNWAWFGGGNSGTSDLQRQP